MSWTRPLWWRSAGSPSHSFATPWRGTQEQNHSAEPAEDQEQAEGGHPTSSGIDQQFGQGKDEIRYGEQSRPRVRVAPSADQTLQWRQQRRDGDNADWPGIAHGDPGQQAERDRGPEPNGQHPRLVLDTHARLRSAEAKEATRSPSARASSCSVCDNSPWPLTVATWLAPYGLPPLRVSVRPCKVYGKPTKYMP